MHAAAGASAAACASGRAFACARAPNRAVTAVRATCAVPARNGPIRDAESSASAAGVPWAITRPPLAPASGPISIIQFASESSCVS